MLRSPETIPEKPRWLIGLLSKLSLASVFHDTSLSEPQGVSCASCHDPKRAFVGNNDSPDPAVAQGSRLPAGARNTPTLTYLSLARRFILKKKKRWAPTALWRSVMSQPADSLGRASQDPEAQAKSPFLAAHEMNNKDIPSVIAKVASSHYADLFREVFGQDALNHPVQALSLSQKPLQHLSVPTHFTRSALSSTLTYEASSHH